MTIFGGLWKDSKGSIALMGALSLSGVLGMSAFAVEGTAGYMAKVRNQRVADMAALAAALAYKANPKDAILSPTAQQVAYANGMTSAVAAVKTKDPSGGDAIQVTVATPVALNLARAFSNRVSYTVSNNAMASLSATPVTPGCIVALSSAATNGIDLSGGTSLVATGCAVQTNAGVTTTNGVGIDAASLTAGKGVFNAQGKNRANAIVTTPGTITANKSGAASDTYGSDARLVAAFARLGSSVAVTAPVAPAAAPSVGNPTTIAGKDNWDFTWSPSANVIKYRDKPNDNASFTVPAGNYEMGALNVGGSIKVKFVGSASSSVSVHGGINNTQGGTLTFGDGAYKINGGFQPGNAMSFGNGSFHIGNGGTVNFSGTVTFGDGDFTLAAPFTPSSGTFKFGAGAHRFASFAPNNGVSVTFGAGAFSVAGAITVSNIAFPAGNIALGKDSNGVSLTVNGCGGCQVTFGTGNIDLEGALVVNGIMTKGNGYLRTGKSSAGAGITVPGTLTANAGAIDTAGTVTIAGTLTSTSGSFNAGGDVTVNSGQLRLGTGNFTVNGKLVTSGGTSVVQTGAGAQTIAGAGGVAISIGSGIATFGNGTFSANGSVGTNSGGKINFGAADYHYIVGNLALIDSATFGAGGYYINGNFTNPTGGVMSGTGVTLILAGKVYFWGGARLELTAPTIDSGGAITDVLLATRSGETIDIGSGAQNQLGGLFYAPNAPMKLSGGATFNPSGSRCLMMVVSTLTLIEGGSGGSSRGAACTSLAGGTASASGTGTVALVQ